MANDLVSAAEPKAEEAALLDRIMARIDEYAASYHVDAVAGITGAATATHREAIRAALPALLAEPKGEEAGELQVVRDVLAERARLGSQWGNETPLQHTLLGRMQSAIEAASACVRASASRRFWLTKVAALAIAAIERETATPKANPATEEGLKVALPSRWRIEREFGGVIALYQLGTAQPTRYECGSVINSLLADLLEPWDDNPDGIKPGEERGPRMNSDTGLWEQ